MSEFAEQFLAAVSLCCALATVLGLSALKLKTKAATRVLLLAKIAMFAAAGLSIVVLDLFIGAFITDDFSIPAVAQYSSTHLPFIYKVSAVWAGPVGSLLLLSVGALVFFGLWLVTFRTDGSSFNAAAMAVGSAVSLVFSALLVLVAKPFARTSVRPDDGAGLSPLLQNFWMVIHPPAFLLAYSAFLVPFVVVVASVFVRSTKDPGLFLRLRRWLLVGIGFLSLGIAAGARWAYLELDWGGYWAWDPIQSLSLVLWLVAVAALHSVNGIELADAFRRWTLLVAPVPFILCLFLAFVGANGILTSVHSFGSSVVSSALLILAGSCLLLWLVCIVRAVKTVSVTPSPRSVFRLDKVRMLYWTGIGFVATAILIGLATFFPAIVRVLVPSGSGLVPTNPFYDRLISIVGILLAFLVGLYRLADLQQRPRGSALPALASCAGGLVCFGILYNLDKNPLLLSLACAMGVFSFVAVLIKLFCDIRAGERIAGDIAHLGVVLLVVAVGLAAIEKSIRIELVKGKEIELSGCRFVYDSFETRSSQGIEMAGPYITVSKGRLNTTLWPRQDTYPGAPEGKTKSHVAIHTGLFEDVYISFDGQTPDGRVIITAKIKPFMFWLWLGAALIVVGSALAVFEGRTRLQPTSEEEDHPQGETW